MLGDKEDSLPALLNISLDVSLDDVKSLYHFCGIYNKNTAKFSKRGLEIFLSTMDRTIIEMVDYLEMAWNNRHHSTNIDN